MGEYKPISCALHEQYQLAAIRRVKLDIEWCDQEGAVCRARLSIKDVYTRNRAEYLLSSGVGDEEIEIRLDRIRKASWANSGIPLIPSRWFSRGSTKMV